MGSTSSRDEKTVLKFIILITAKLAQLLELPKEMSPAKLADFPCKYCGKSFNDGRRLGGHIRQSHQVVKPGDSQHSPTSSSEGENAARVLELWRAGEDPVTVVETLRVHPRFVKEVLREYDELLNEWKKFNVA
jgi:hypothetical protein